MIYENVRVVVIARQELAREGMRRILAAVGFSVHAASADQFDTNSKQFEAPDLVVIETDTADEGIDIASILRQPMPGAKIVVISPECELSSILRAFAAGVDGYLTRSIACDAMVGALKLVLMGEKVIPTGIVSELVNTSFASRPHIWDATPVDANLSERETEILRQLVLGEANKVISRNLQISEATVKVHVKAILRKLRVLNRTQAAIWGVNHGIVGTHNGCSSNAL